MQNNENDQISMPSPEEVNEEIERLRYKREYRRVLASTINALVVVAAIAALLATLLLPLLQVSGTSMEPTLQDGDLLVLVKRSKMETGDLCGFYWQNKLLLKRVIGTPGDIVDIEESGEVYVNGLKLDEPYVSELAYGECDITFPYQVPDNRYFVMGDHRATSIDSRNSAIGCVDKEQMEGKVLICIWPFNRVAFVR